MNWEQKLEDLYLSQSLIEEEIRETQDKIYLESPEYYIQSNKDLIFEQRDLVEFNAKDPDTNLTLYYYASSDIIDKKYLETYIYQTIYRNGDIIGYERREIEQQIVSASAQINLKTLRTE
jgi:hypothetical protein